MRTKIKNYTVKEFFELPASKIDEYISILSLLEPEPTKHELSSLKFREVEFIKQNINDDEKIHTIFCYIDEICDLNGISIIEFFGKYNFIIASLKKMIEVEKQHLEPNYPNLKWEAVNGSQRLKELGVLPIVDNLAGGDPLKYEAILDLPYLTVFKKLKLDTLRSDLEHEMSKIKKEK